MQLHRSPLCLGILSVVLLGTTTFAAPPEGFTSLFDGESFDGWIVPEGDNGHWNVVDGVIDYDSERVRRLCAARRLANQTHTVCQSACANRQAGRDS